MDSATPPATVASERSARAGHAMMRAAAVAMIGWAVGKFTAARAGSDSAKSFAQLNVLPLLLWTIAQFTEGNGLTSAIFPALLLAAYIYTGFVAE